MFEVGQVWNTRGGRKVEIKSTTHPHELYPIFGVFLDLPEVCARETGRTFTEKGYYYSNPFCLDANDLMSLVRFEGDPVTADVIKAIKAPKSPWQPIETAPKDGRHILTWNITPTYDEDARRTIDVEMVGVSYWLFGSWMDYPAAPSFIQGKRYTHWMPVPEGPGK
jgi:hypothetical protein